MNQFYPILILVLLFNSCANDTPPTTIPETTYPTTASTNQSAAILIFKKEKQIEIWENGTKGKTFTIQIDTNAPIGIFSASQIDKGIQLNFPNKFYKEKNYHVEFEPHIKFNQADLSELDLNNIPIYVFPNDSRNGQPFVAKFSSPHWMAELYAKMNSFLQKYK